MSGFRASLHWCSPPWLLVESQLVGTPSVSVVVGACPLVVALTNHQHTQLHASVPRCKARVGVIMPITEQAMALACTNTQHHCPLLLARGAVAMVSVHNTLQSVCCGV